MIQEELESVLAEKRDDLARLWLEEHSAAVPVRSDEAIIKGVHSRSRSFLEALRRAMAGRTPEDWGSFSHREVVQILTLMARSLAEGGATAGATGELVPAFGRALERLGVLQIASILIPLSGVVVEVFTAARFSSLTKRNMDVLIRTMPIFKLRPETLLVAACGAPDRETAAAIIERVLRAVLKLRVDFPVVVLDLTYVEDEHHEALTTFLTLPAEVEALGGSCPVIGVTPARQDALRKVGVELNGVELWDTLEQGLAALMPEGLLQRIGRAFR